MKCNIKNALTNSNALTISNKYNLSINTITDIFESITTNLVYSEISSEILINFIENTNENRSKNFSFVNRNIGELKDLFEEKITINEVPVTYNDYIGMLVTSYIGYIRTSYDFIYLLITEIYNININNKSKMKKSYYEQVEDYLNNTNKIDLFKELQNKPKLLIDFSKLNNDIKHNTFLKIKYDNIINGFLEVKVLNTKSKKIILTQPKIDIKDIINNQSLIWNHYESIINHLL